MTWRHGLVAVLASCLWLAAVAQEPVDAAPAEEESTAAADARPEDSTAPEVSPEPLTADAPPPEPLPAIPVEPLAAAEEPPPLPQTEGTTRIEDVIVTATKREASARDLAGTVNALSGEDLADRGAQDIEDIVTAVPGVNLVDEKSGGSPTSVKRITIRGIAAGQNQVDTVGVFIDETPFSDPFQPLSSADVNPFDISQVEVLKGPVGTLFGGSALNGAIRYIPQKPLLGEWEGKAFAEWRTFKDGGNAPIFGAALNVPFFGGDELALRIVGIQRETAGYVDSVNRRYKGTDVNGMEQSSVRAILRWMPLDELDLSLMYVHQDTLQEDYPNVTDNRDGRLESTANPQPSPSRVDYDLWQLKGSWAFDWADLVVIASQADKSLDADIDQSATLLADPPASVLFTTLDALGTPRSQEVRLVSAPGGDWDWLLGLFNARYEIDALAALTAGNDTVPPWLGGLPLPLPVLHPDGLVVGYSSHKGTVDERSAFGEASWRFAPDWQLTAGLRLYEFAYDVHVIFDGAICAATDPACVLNLLHSDIPLTNEENGTSPKLSLKWDVSDNVMLYATGARGFRFGGVNPVAHPEIPRTYGSDSLWSYEAGTRTQWFDNTLIADVTAFYIDWTNAQFQTTTSDGLGFGFTDNVGAVEGQGVEGQLIWLTPIPGVKLTAIAAWADIVTAQDFTKAGVGTTMTVPAGTRWPRAPEWQTTTMLDWTHLFGVVEIGAGVNHTYLGEALQNFGFNADVVIFDYSTVGLQFTAKPIMKDWWPELAINVNNLTDERGLNYSYDGAPGGTGARVRTYTAPRNISARLTFDF